MIRVTQGTTYITAGAFVDRYSHMKPGASFSYATGDLADACNASADARELCDLLWDWSEHHKIVMSEQARPDLVSEGGPEVIEYLATKCRGLA